MTGDGCLPEFSGKNPLDPFGFGTRAEGHLYGRRRKCRTAGGTAAEMRNRAAVFTVQGISAAVWESANRERPEWFTEPLREAFHVAENPTVCQRHPG